MSHRFSSILVLSLTASLSLAAGQVAAQSVPMAGTWANDHGSVLVISSVCADGSVTGTYSSSAPGYKCAGIAFPIVGWLDGPRISYIVR